MNLLKEAGSSFSVPPCKIGSDAILLLIRFSLTRLRSPEADRLFRGHRPDIKFKPAVLERQGE